MRRVSERAFQNRRDAGRILAKAVLELPGLENGIVLGLVRGGVPVAFELAQACGLPLDILVVRKLGAPGQEELAMGAIASGGEVVLNEDVVRTFHVSGKMLDLMIEHEKRSIVQLEHIYREGQPPMEIEGRAVILADDGLATGASMRAAIQAVKSRARSVIVAVPVGARSTCEELAKEVNALVCAVTPEVFDAVSLFYREFEPTSDEEVSTLLREGRMTRDQRPWTGK
jgi:predicted phosphoribosyltransferase